MGVMWRTRTQGRPRLVLGHMVRFSETTPHENAPMGLVLGVTRLHSTINFQPHLALRSAELQRGLDHPLLGNRHQRMPSPLGRVSSHRCRPSPTATKRDGA